MPTSLHKCCCVCVGTMEVNLSGTIYTHTFTVTSILGNGDFFWTGVVSPGGSTWSGTGNIDVANGTMEWEITYDPPVDYTGWTTSGTVSGNSASGNGADTMSQTWTWSIADMTCFLTDW